MSADKSKTPYVTDGHSPNYCNCPDCHVEDCPAGVELAAAHEKIARMREALEETKKSLIEDGAGACEEPTNCSYCKLLATVNAALKE